MDFRSRLFLILKLATSTFLPAALVLGFAFTNFSLDSHQQKIFQQHYSKASFLSDFFDRLFGSSGSGSGRSGSANPDPYNGPPATHTPQIPPEALAEIYDLLGITTAVGKVDPGAESQVEYNYRTGARDCRVVDNNRTPSTVPENEDQGILIPRNSDREWDSFKANPPPNVVLNNCGPPPPPPINCAVYITWDNPAFSTVSNAIREPLRSGQPQAGILPEINARPASMNQFCAMLGCGPATGVYTREYSSPGNNAIAVWNGTAWEKRNASRDNYKFGNRRGREIIRCSLPGSPPPARIEYIDTE